MDFLKTVASEYSKSQQQGSSNNNNDNGNNNNSSSHGHGQNADYYSQSESYGQSQTQQHSSSSTSGLPGNLSGLSGMLLNNNMFDLLDSDSDKKKTAEAAAQAAGSHADTDMFHSVLNRLGQNKQTVADQKNDVDEGFAVSMFKKFVENKSSDTSSSHNEKAGSDNLGAAAAMQAIKMFNSSSSSGSSGSQAMLLGLAMSEGSKLFDKTQAEGKVAQGTTKESVIEQAVQFALKFFLKSQSGGSSGSSSGSASLLSMASKFL